MAYALPQPNCTAIMATEVGEREEHSLIIGFGEGQSIELYTEDRKTVFPGSIIIKDVESIAGDYVKSIVSMRAWDANAGVCVRIKHRLTDRASSLSNAFHQANIGAKIYTPLPVTLLRRFEKFMARL